MPISPTALHCELAAEVLAKAEADVPEPLRSLRTQLKTLRREYERAAKYYGRAEKQGLSPEIRAVGGIGNGECVMTGQGPARLRRTTPTGVELMVNGAPNWENITGPTAPYVVVDAQDFDR